jgi:hypothetical protein
MQGDSPSPGDVLIIPDPVSGVGYTLSTAPAGPSQLWYPSYEHAMRTAVEWAETSGISVWRANDGAEFERVRVQES